MLSSPAFIYGVKIGLRRYVYYKSIYLDLVPYNISICRRCKYTRITGIDSGTFSCSHGVCINSEMIVHLLWAGDLVLLSDPFHGLQTQLEALGKFIHKKHMPVNDMKTKFMIAGKPEISKLLCNSVDMAEVNDNQYLVMLLVQPGFQGIIRSKLVSAPMWSS